MQLKDSRKAKGQVRKVLGLVTANLFVATGAHAGSTASMPQPNLAGNAAGSVIDDSAVEDTGASSVDTAVLFYQERGGRVKAVEPTASLNLVDESGDTFTMRFTFDSLTGATPNGAAPWKDKQTFTTPAYVPGTQMAMTTASGGSQLVTIPGTDTVVSQYDTPANQIPLDSGFHDRRYAGSAGYTWQWNRDTKLTIGGAASKEKDYRSYSVNAGFSRDFFDHNTTLSLSGNFEYDQSRPYYGTPTPFTQMNGDLKGPGDNKSVTSVVAGITQVMNRHWLLQLNYTIGLNKGYQTDPYKILSVVDPTTGGPLEYLYENRPRSRTRQSVYLANKVALGPTVTSLSARYYHDNWGIDSITAEASEYVPIGDSFYVEPQFRYYRQTAADFFHYYLLAGDGLPDYASADYRLAKFHATTIGLKLGYKFGTNLEAYLQAEDYRQSGEHTVPGAPGDLANQDFFAGVHADDVVAGVKVSFR